MTDDSAGDARSPRDRILAMATAARALREPRKRWAVKALVHDRYRFHVPGKLAEMPCAIEEILQAAYGDPNGEAYWGAWFFPRDDISSPEHLDILIDVDATHQATSEMERALLKRALTASAAGHRDKAAIEALEYLRANPDTAHLMTEGLLRVMGAGSTARRPADRVDPAGPRARRKTGPRPVTRDRVIAEMRASLDNGVDVFKVKELALCSMYKAGRATIRDAKSILKREIEERT